MKLISEIINDLINSEKSLTSPLLKTKVLATKLKNTELLKWVNNELAGYNENDDTLPEYRKTVAMLKGTYKNGYQLYNNQPLAITALPTELAAEFLNTNLIMSVESIESLLSDGNAGVLHMPLPAEICNLIAKGYRLMGNPFFEVLSANKEMSKSGFVQILSEIRSKLLDLMLIIDEEYGKEDITNLIQDKKQEINDLIIKNMSNNIITGDGNILNSGDNNKIQAKIKIEKGNKDQLKSELSKAGISENDIAEVIEIIDSEAPNIEEKKPGKNVGNWMTKMIGKAVDGSWQIGIGTAGELLATVIGSYYGY